MSKPKIHGNYTNIYIPAGDIFPGPDAGELETGRYYSEWVPNDHCFVTDTGGRWHAFGITHPLTSLDNVHLGEHQSFHAIAPDGPLKEALADGTWKDLPKILPPASRPQEEYAHHAPYIVRIDGLYHMVYGPTPIRYAVSRDLLEWTPMGPLHNAPEGRDPCILHWDDTYYLLVCADYEVRVATSKDFKVWKPNEPLLTMENGLQAESPCIISHDNSFYLFVCGWDGIWDKKELQGAYQHVTYVFQSDNPLHFDYRDLVTTLDAHAPEVLKDESGDWYISSAEWPHRGISLARLIWE